MEITGPLWLWSRACLSNHWHYVSLNSVNSAKLPVLSGVPQGSVLGPLLFIIFSNNIPDITLRSLPFMFADDIKLVKSIVTSSDKMLLQEDLTALECWCDKWHLSLMNVDKCFVIEFMRFIHPSLLICLSSLTIYFQWLCICVSKDVSTTVTSALVHMEHFIWFVGKFIFYTFNSESSIPWYVVLFSHKLLRTSTHLN